jgi:Pectinacetylesterase
MPRSSSSFALPFLLLVVVPLAACGDNTTPSVADSGSPDVMISHDSGMVKGGGKEGGATKEASIREASPPADVASGDASFPLGTAITAPSDQWTWVPFADAVCGNGSSTGLGVNLSSASSDVLIYFEGGGACWNEFTCDSAMTASYFTSGYNEATFQAEATDTSYLSLPNGFFDRTASNNPFQGYSYVYLPYCSGDVFAGSATAEFGATTAYFEGFKNVGAYLARIIPTFPNTKHVVVAGSSAGGFGAAINWWRIRAAFPNARIDLIDDSGTPMPASISTSSVQAPVWNLAQAFPPGCSGCAMDESRILGYYASIAGTNRLGLLSYYADSVLPAFFGITEEAFETGLTDDLDSYDTPGGQLQAFIVNASGHVLWFSPDLTTGSANVSVRSFVTELVTDSSAWATDGFTDGGVTSAPPVDGGSTSGDAGSTYDAGGPHDAGDAGG